MGSYSRTKAVTQRIRKWSRQPFLYECLVACRLTSGSLDCDTVLQPAALPRGLASITVLPLLRLEPLELEEASQATGRDFPHTSASPPQPSATM